MKLARVIEKVTMNPWLITPGAYQAIVTLIDSKLAGARFDFTNDDPPDNGSHGIVDEYGIAQLSVSGTLGNRLSLIEKICGGTDYQELEQLCNSVMDEGAKGILFHFDSPGGMATGCPEMSEYIASIPLPKVAFTDSICCSAAYFMASSCDAIFATQTAEVGSIGCLVPWVDRSQLFAVSGLKYDPIVSDNSPLKATMGGPSLTPEQRQYLQEKVNMLADSFKNHVSQFRDLDYDSLKAGSYFGDRAVKENLVDQLGNYADAYNELLSRVTR